MLAWRHVSTWLADYKPEIFPLGCSSERLSLELEPPPLGGWLTGPVFVFPEVAEPRCKHLYSWQRSLFLGRNGTGWRGNRHCAGKKTPRFHPTQERKLTSEQCHHSSPNRESPRQSEINASLIFFPSWEKGKLLTLHFWSIRHKDALPFFILWCW